MQLLHLSPFVAHPPQHGGRIRARQLLRAAVEHGAHVVNFALAADEAEAAAAEGLRAEGIEVVTAVIPPFPTALTPTQRAAKWARLALGRSSLLPRRRCERAAAALRDLVRARKFDLAVVDFPWMDVYRRELGRTPFVASTHNVEGDLLADAASTLTGPAAWAARRDAAILLRREASWAHRAAGVVCVSEADARRFFQLAHGARTVVAPNGVDLAAVRTLPPPPADGPLLFVGSFDYPPNVDAARRFVGEFLPAVRAALGPVEVVLAGRAPGADVRALTATPGVRVEADPADLAPLYAAARAAIVPLRHGGGSRLKILEAFAYGRPVVSTTAGAAGLGARDGRELLLADDPPSFAAALARLRDTAGLAASLVADARAYVEREHDWADARRVYGAALEAALRLL